MSNSQKEIYLFRFESQRRADFWMGQTIEKFHDEIRDVNKFEGKVEFDDCTYYFWSVNRVSRLTRNVTVYGEEAIYIILNDPHRKRLATFENNSEEEVTT